MAAISIASAYKPKDPVAGGVGPDVLPEKVGFMGLVSTEKSVSHPGLELGWSRQPVVPCPSAAFPNKNEPWHRGTDFGELWVWVSGQQRWVEIGGYTQ